MQPHRSHALLGRLGERDPGALGHRQHAPDPALCRVRCGYAPSPSRKTDGEPGDIPQGSWVGKGLLAAIRSPQSSIAATKPTHRVWHIARTPQLQRPRLGDDTGPGFRNPCLGCGLGVSRPGTRDLTRWIHLKAVPGSDRSAASRCVYASPMLALVGGPNEISQ